MWGWYKESEFNKLKTIFGEWEAYSWSNGLLRIFQGGKSWRLNLALFLDCGPGLKFGKGGLPPKLGLTGQGWWSDSGLCSQDHLWKTYFQKYFKERRRTLLPLPSSTNPRFHDLNIWKHILKFYAEVLVLSIVDFLSIFSFHVIP